jgi:hypothetical protein
MDGGRRQKKVEKTCRKGWQGGGGTGREILRKNAANYFVVFLAMEASRELPQRKVTTPTTTRYFTVSNMFSWSQKYRYSVNMAPRPAWKP